MERTNNGILLESGTNELEIVEFNVGGSRFGINVIKVREIIVPAPITKIPHTHEHIQGIIQLRGDVLPVIDMTKVLGFPPANQPENDKFIISEFNNTKVVFRVRNVTQIHRISWEQIERPSDLYQGINASVTGVIKRGEEMILMLDYEKMITDIHPASGIKKEKLQILGERQRSEKTVLVAEDSAFLRKMLSETLEEAGYIRQQLFEDGKAALDHLESLAASGIDPADEIQLVITDIEMPRMDGHHLTRRIKENSSLQKLPVIIFSSLITNELRHKGERVGAEDQVSKPEIVELVQKIDRYIL
ncbi:chemotaxis protein [Bacillus marinisedimentorum]|uniref:chemotaxis protein n=1 Tax=Bacillus marinisedimentorum TaxID=1821260 RepID=UPI0008729D2D|nr:chemotaxis protein [Bacillus marinisedimentorum]